MANVTVTIEGVFGADGDWPLDTTYFTNRELHEIKKMSGVRAGELSDALAAGDSDLIVCIASIALARNGRNVPVDVLWEAAAGMIRIEPVEDEEAADQAVPPPSSNGDAPNSTGSNEPSGETSKPSGAPLASVPSPTGHPV